MSAPDPLPGFSCRCTDCSRVFASFSETPPRNCPWCGTWGTVKAHPHPESITSERPQRRSA